MFTAITTCITAFFNGITKFFTAFDNCGTVAVVLSGVAVHTSEMYSDEAKIKRLKQQAVLEKELSDTKAANVVA